MKPLVVIPYYNHPATLRDVAERSLARCPDVLVVDDGSERRAEDLLEGLPVRVLRHVRNRGKGEAIRTAALWAEDHGFSHLVTLDADGQHHPEDLPLLFQAMREHPLALHVGKRDFEAAEVPGASVFGRSFSNFWLRVQTGKSLGDVQSGYRVYPLAVLQGLMLREKGFAFEVEVLVRAAWAGVELRDVDVSVTYPEGRISHFRLLRDNLRLSLLNTRLTMRSMLPWHRKRLSRQADGTHKITALRPLRSLEQLLGEHASPRSLALSAGLGIFVGTLPLLFVQTITVLALAGYLRLNRMTALAVNQLCTPPFVPALCIEAGHYLRTGRFLTEFNLETLGRQAPQRLWEWLLGALVLAPVFSALIGGVVLLLAVFLRRRRLGHAV